MNLYLGFEQGHAIHSLMPFSKQRVIPENIHTLPDTTRGFYILTPPPQLPSEIPECIPPSMPLEFHKHLSPHFRNFVLFIKPFGIPLWLSNTSTIQQKGIYAPTPQPTKAYGLYTI